AEGVSSGISWARTRSLLRLVTRITHGRIGLPPILSQLGICRKSACHTSYSRGRFLVSHFLMKPSGPFGEGPAFSVLAATFSRSQATAPDVDFHPARKLPTYSRASFSSPGL